MTSTGVHELLAADAATAEMTAVDPLELVALQGRLDALEAGGGDEVPAAPPWVRVLVVLAAYGLQAWIWTCTDTAARGEHTTVHLAALVAVALVALGADELLGAMARRLAPPKGGA